MASGEAVESARRFCGPELYAASATHARVSLADVPLSPDGLRLLASNGNWSEVLALAERLEAEAAAQAERHARKCGAVPRSASPPDPPKRVRPVDLQEEKSATQSSPVVGMTTAASPDSGLSADAAARSARLPFVLVQVIANLKMRRVAAAKKVIDAQGDIEGGEEFRHPVTRESFAPFSLRLIAAFFPLYVGAPMEAQKKLYALLEECLSHERSCCTAGSDVRMPAIEGDVAGRPSAVSVALQRTWTQRVLRVQRALLHVHIHMNQHSLAYSLVERILRTEDAWHHKFQDLPDDLYQLRHVLQLQQLFCLALHVGDSFHAQTTHAAIRKIATGNSAQCDTQVTSSNAVSSTSLCKLITLSCDAFLAVFKSEYSEAMRLFRQVIDTAVDMKQALGTAADAVDTDGCSSSASEGFISEETLRRCVLQDICANAQVSFATCQAYRSDCDPTTHMSNLCTTLEGFAKAEPQVLCSSDAFLESLVRFYTLSGDRTDKLKGLADLLEVFRCDRGSLPNLEALV